MHHQLLLSSHNILIVGFSILSVFLFWWQWQWRYFHRDRHHHQHQLWIPTRQCSSRLLIGWLRIFRMNGGPWSSLLLGSVITGSKNATLILKVTLSFPILTILSSPMSTRSFPTSIKVKFLLRNCANNIQPLDLLHFWSKGHSFAFVLNRYLKAVNRCSTYWYIHRIFEISWKLRDADVIILVIILSRKKRIELCYPSELSITHSLVSVCILQRRWKREIFARTWFRLERWNGKRVEPWLRNRGTQRRRRRLWMWRWVQGRFSSRGRLAQAVLRAELSLE